MNKKDSDVVKFLEHKAYKLREWSIIMTGQASSGHPTSCLSAADIVAGIFFYAMHYDPYNYKNPDNDRFILSKGHAAPLLYAAWRELDMLTDEEMLSYRAFDSVLEGHPTKRFAYTEAATGSLGMGLSIGAGQALCAKMDKRAFRTYVVMGDSESAEGSVWEAVQLAAHYTLDNLICFIDVNDLGQSTETMFDYNIQRYHDIFTAFGWQSFEIDGHDMQQIMDVLDKARHVTGKPIVIIAKTVKGFGVDRVAGKQGFHGRAFTGEQEKDALAQLKNNFSDAAQYNNNDFVWIAKHPQKSPHAFVSTCSTINMAQSAYSKGEMIATRKAYGQTLALLGDNCDSIVCLDAEVKNSTFADIFETMHPTRFIQCFVAEQNMIGMGIGFECRGKIPFISTFSSFMSRAHDQIRMAAISQSALRLVGSHCGVSIGQDGPSQMGLEDIALMRCLPDSVVLYPCDAVSTHKLVEQMARYDKGISYLRTTRMETPVIYDNSEQFPIGGCKILKKSDNKDIACIIAAGVTVFEALKAHEILAQENIFVSVIDLYSVKPIDASQVISVARASNNIIITVEDHYVEGGIGEAVAHAVNNASIMVHSLAVTRLPRSGKPDQLLAYESIDAVAIIALVRKISDFLGEVRGDGVSLGEVLTK